MVVAALVASVALAAAVGVADATTGPNATHAPKILVPKAIGKPFTGRWKITHIPKRAKLAGGQVQVEYTLTKVPYLYGTLQLKAYDVNGRTANFLASLFPFAHSGGKLRATIITTGSDEKLGRVTFNDPTSADRLTGTLTFQGNTYPISYKRSDANAPISPDATSDGDSTAAPKTTTGDLGASDSDDAVEPADAGASAGLYAPVVRVAMALVAGAAS